MQGHQTKDLASSGHSQVTFVQLIYDLASALWWYNDSIPPQKTSIMDTDLIFPLLIGLQLIINFVEPFQPFCTF